MIPIGDHVAWDDAGKQFKMPVVGLYPMCIAKQAAGSRVATVKVRFDGVATVAA